MSIVMIFVFLMVIGTIALVLLYLIKGYSYQERLDKIDEIPPSFNEEEEEREKD